MRNSSFDSIIIWIVTICQVYLLKDTYPVSKLWVGSDHIVLL